MRMYTIPLVFLTLLLPIIKPGKTRAEPIPCFDCRTDECPSLQAPRCPGPQVKKAPPRRRSPAPPPIPPLSAPDPPLSAPDAPAPAAPLLAANLAPVVLTLPENKALSAPALGPMRRPRWPGPWKWVGLGLGAGLAGTGAALLAIDGRPGTCPEHCGQVLNTKAGGATLAGLGGAVLAGAAVLFVFDDFWNRPKRRRK